jgi:hypothetical protein
MKFRAERVIINPIELFAPILLGESMIKVSFFSIERLSLKLEAP